MCQCLQSCVEVVGFLCVNLMERAATQYRSGTTLGPHDETNRPETRDPYKRDKPTSCGRNDTGKTTASPAATAGRQREAAFAQSGRREGVRVHQHLSFYGTLNFGLISLPPSTTCMKVSGMNLF